MPDEALTIDREEHQLDVGDVSLHFYTIRGADFVTLLEPGDGSDAGYWGSFPEVLNARTGASVVLYDRAGFGNSERVNTPHDMLQEAMWALEGLSQLGLDRRLILVGHSYGGWLVQLIASESSDAVAGLVLIDPGTTEYFGASEVAPHFQKRRAEAIQRILEVPREEWTNWHHAFLRELEADWGKRLSTMARANIPDGVPYCVITAGIPWLEETSEQWRAAHEHLAGSSPNGRLIVSERTGHMIPNEDPELVLQAVEATIERAKPN